MINDVKTEKKNAPFLPFFVSYGSGLDSIISHGLFLQEAWRKKLESNLLKETPIDLHNAVISSNIFSPISIVFLNFLK